MPAPVTLADVPMAPRKADEDVWSYPRPPLLQRVPNTLKIIWSEPSTSSTSSTAGSSGRTETIIAETTDALRVCETSHPPTYYLPPSSLKVKLDKTGRRSMCEWKGQATYWNLDMGEKGGKVENRIWSYETPVPAFAPLKGYLSFYASSSASTARGKGQKGEWRCYVDGEEVGIQEGDFYGGWITSNIKGKMKGGPGTWGW